MTVQELQFSTGPLFRSFRSARRWLWLQTGIRTLGLSLCIASAVAFAAAALTLFQAPVPLVTWLWLACAAVPLTGLVAAILLRPSESRAVRAVDVRLGLHQQLGTAHELLAHGAETRLVPWQLARASDLATNLPLGSAFPLLPRRELAISAALSTAAAVLLALASLGVVIPNPLEGLRIPGMTPSAAVAPERPLFGNSGQTDGSRSRSPSLESTRQILNQIQRQAQRGALSQGAATSALQQANAELSRAVQESRLRQEALDSLANQLRGTAAGAEIAQSLRRGDYEKATQQIRELGRQADQLSATARQQLGQALSNAASQSQGLEQLARSESRAAQSLQGRDPGDTVSSMDRLAQAVEDAGRQVIPQSELAETWQQLDQLDRQLSGGPRNGQSSVAPPPAQSSEGTGERSSSASQGPISGEQQSGGGQSQGAFGQSAGELPGGGQPGNVRGGNPLGDPNSQASPDGTPMELPARVGGRFSDQPDSSHTAPSVMREGDGVSTSSAEQPADGAAGAPAENVFVPGDRRSVVRDYFSNK